jgi:hypothetical protein
MLLHKLVLSDNWLGPELKQLTKQLSPPLIPAEIFRHGCIMMAWDVGLRIVYVLVYNLVDF